MKKILLTAIALCTLSLSMAQEEEELTDSQERMEKFSNVKKHEVSLDVTAALAIPAFSPRYEYVLGRYSGVGADLFIAIDDDDIEFDTYEKISLTPYYRQYFFSKEDYGAKGFYGEGFLKLYTYEISDDFFDINGNFQEGSSKSYFETAIGVGIGWKWVSDSGFLIDLGFGLGRNLGIANDDTNFNTDLRVRGGLNFGWRF